MGKVTVEGKSDSGGCVGVATVRRHTAADTSRFGSNDNRIPVPLRAMAARDRAACPANERCEQKPGAVMMEESIMAPVFFF